MVNRRQKDHEKEEHLHVGFNTVAIISAAAEAKGNSSAHILIE